MTTGIQGAGIALAGCAFLLISAHRSAAPAEIVPGAIQSQPYGCTAFELEPVDNACPGGHFHTGIDLAAPTGTPVLAAADGVAMVGTGGPCGIHVLLAHSGGDETLYCHLSEVTVREGQVVGAGQRIGSVGASGFATGPHLHFEVHSGGRPVDPALWLRRSPTTTVNRFGGR